MQDTLINVTLLSAAAQLAPAPREAILLVGLDPPGRHHTARVATNDWRVHCCDGSIMQVRRCIQGCLSTVQRVYLHKQMVAQLNMHAGGCNRTPVIAWLWCTCAGCPAALIPCHPLVPVAGEHLAPAVAVVQQMTGVRSSSFQNHPLWDTLEPPCLPSSPAWLNICKVRAPRAAGLTNSCRTRRKDTCCLP